MHVPHDPKTILLADDETMVRSVLRMLLTKTGYQVAEAVDGQDALNQFVLNPERFALAILDVQMPNLDGHQALESMRQIAPRLKALLLTGAIEDDASVSGPDTLILGKPFANQVFLAHVQHLTTRTAEQ